jgi:hypothetical protein
LSAASGVFALIAGLALLLGGATRSYGTVTSNDAPDDGGGHGADDVALARRGADDAPDAPDDGGGHGVDDAPDAPDDRGVDV